MDKIHNPSTKLPPLRPRMQSKIPTAPLAKQRRFSWSAKNMCCRPATIQEDSRIPSAPVPQMKIPPPVFDARSIKTQTVKSTQLPQPTFPRTSESKLRPMSEAPVSRGSVVPNKASARRSTLVMTTQSSPGRETPSKIPTASQRGSEDRSTRKERRRSTRDGDASASTHSKRASAVNSSSERTKPQITLQTPGATTWKPLTLKNSESKTQKTRSLSHRRRESAPSTTKASEKKPKEEKKSRSFSGVLRKSGSGKSDQQEKQGLKAERKSEMTLWKRFTSQISSKTIRRIKSDEEVMVQRKPSFRKKIAAQASAIPLRRKSFPTAISQMQMKDTDVESVTTPQPVFAKKDPDTLSSPMTPRSLALTNVNDADQSARREIRVLQRCTTLTPEPNPKNVFQSFQGFTEFRGSEIQEERLYTDGQTSVVDEPESRKQSIFSPFNPQSLNQKDSTYSSVSADLLQSQSQSSGSPSFCLEEIKSRGSPRKVFSNPLLSVSPELQSSPTSLKHPAPIRVQKLRIPNMPCDHSSQDSMGTPGCPTLRQMDCSQVEAQCEWIRETLKEESKRLMTMTTMLEGLTPRPATAAGVDSVSNQDLDRRYIEKINDLQLENRHLRQLLEFSIGSMRKQTWVPTPVPTTPCYGHSFNNPIAAFDQVDTGAEHDARTPQEKLRRKSTNVKRLRNDPEYIAQLTESLQNKDKLLKVVIESAAQITSLQKWYAKRLDELDRDRKRLQTERDECVKELDRCTACSPDLLPSKAFCQVTPRVRSLNMVFRA